MQEPEKGFYYHFKRAEMPFAYEVIGTAFSTESGGVHGDDPAEFLKDAVVIYRPLYESALVYKAGKRFWVRPLAMFTGTVTKDGKTFPRFQKITDPELITKLEKIRDEMYS